MKKTIILFLILSLLLGGCSGKNSNDTGQVNNSGINGGNTAGQNTKGTPTPQTVVTPTIPAGENGSTIQPSSTDASVEALVALGESLLNALFADDEEEALTYCKGTLKDTMEEKPTKYINDKPDYQINNIETTIKPLEGSKYLLMSTVSAISKKDNTKKYSFKYELTALKEKSSYYIIDYKRP